VDQSELAIKSAFIRTGFSSPAAAAIAFAGIDVVIKRARMLYP
jgi:hypothetical protein